jgi:hypothetical protein
MVPTGIDLAQRRVELVDMASSAFAEPFFDESVRAVLAAPSAEGGRPSRITMAIDDWLEREDPPAPQDPAGFIFHVGRCGSTLFSHLLGLANDVVVVKEAATVTRLLHALSWSRASLEVPRTLIHAVLDGASTHQLENLLVAMVHAHTTMSAGAGGEKHSVVLKLQPACAREAHTLLRLFPNTPGVFIYRDFAPAVASMLRAPATSMPKRLIEDRPVLSVRFPTMETMTWRWPTLPRVAAHTWATAVTGVAGLAPGRLHSVTYEEIVNDPFGSLATVAKHLELPLSDRPLVEHEAQFDARGLPTDGHAQPAQRKLADPALAGIFGADLVDAYDELEPVLAKFAGRFAAGRPAPGPGA